MKPSLVAFTAVAAFVASGAQAALINHTVTATSGAQSTALWDTGSGLEWLSPVTTRNRTISQVLGGYGGWVQSGYRYASTAEFQLLLAHAGLPGATGGVTSWNAPPAVDALHQLVMDLGWTYEWQAPSPGDPLGRYGVWGIFSDLYPGDGHTPSSRLYGSLISGSSAGGVSWSGQWLFDGQDNLVGSFLVRERASVPEPGVLGLALCSLGIMVSSARQRRTSTPRREA